MKVLLLGAGMQGKAALHDLLSSQDVRKVIAADRDLDALQRLVASQAPGGKVEVAQLDANDPQGLAGLMQRQPDVAINLLPVAFGGAVARAAVRHGVHLVSASYVVPQVEAVAADAQAKGVTILPEFGMDPGIDLVLLGEAVRSFDVVEEIVTYGAGLPERDAADNALRYKVTWTLDGVLNSYVRPARVIVDGKTVDISPHDLFAPENTHPAEIEGLGTLEAFPNGDAAAYLRQLGIHPQELRRMGRYTLRWPGHCAFWKKLVDLHLLDNEPVSVEGVAVNRRRFLAAVIEPHIRLGAQERDLALVRVEVGGSKGGQRLQAVYQVLDWRDLQTGLSAMSRTVGYTASIGAQLIGNGTISKRGLLSPLRDVPYGVLVRELGKRDIQVTSWHRPVG